MCVLRGLAGINMHQLDGRKSWCVYLKSKAVRPISILTLSTGIACRRRPRRAQSLMPIPDWRMCTGAAEHSDGSVLLHLPPQSYPGSSIVLLDSLRFYYANSCFAVVRPLRLTPPEQNR